MSEQKLRTTHTLDEIAGFFCGKRGERTVAALINDVRLLKAIAEAVMGAYPEVLACLSKQETETIDDALKAGGYLEDNDAQR